MEGIYVKAGLQRCAVEGDPVRFLRQTSYRICVPVQDFVTVVDGREGIVSDVDQAPARLRGFIIQSVQALTSARGFDEAPPGQIPPDQASQQRLPELSGKLRAIAALR